MVIKVFTDKFKIVGSRCFTSNETSYAEALKRKYINDNDTHRTDTITTVPDTPPAKLGRKNLYYSKFSPPSAIKLNTHDSNIYENQDENTNKLGHILERLTKLEKSKNANNQMEQSEVSSLSQEEWSKNMETKFALRMKEVEERLEGKIEKFIEQQMKLLDAMETRILGAFNATLNKQLDTKFKDLLLQMKSVLVHPESTTVTPARELGDSGKSK